MRSMNRSSLASPGRHSRRDTGGNRAKTTANLDVPGQRAHADDGDHARGGEPGRAYSPGRSIAYRPVYSVGADGWSWHCGYAGWRSGAKVSWTCRLYEIYLDEGGWENKTITVHKGSWTPGSSSYTTPTWVHKVTIGDGELCVEAYALSVDGGATNRVCAS